MFEKGKNLTDSVHEAEIWFRVQDQIENISFDSGRRGSFSPRLPELRNIHIFRRSEMYELAAPNIHKYYVLWICLAGTGQLFIDGAHAEIRARESLLVTPGVPHVRLPDDKKRRVSWLLIRFECDDSSFFVPFRNARFHLDRCCAEKLSELLTFYDSRKDPLGCSACGAALLSFLMALFARREDGGEGAVPEGVPACLREVCELMMQMPPVKDPFARVAARWNITAAYLHVLFRKKTGLTSRDFMNRQKLNLAEHLLANSELSISEIALRCGFSGVYPFSRFFSRKRHISPSAYRKNKP